MDLKTALGCKGVEDSSRTPRTRKQLSVAEGSKTNSITKAQAQVHVAKDHFQYKKRFKVHWIEGSSDYSKAILITWRTNLGTKAQAADKLTRNYDFYMSAHAGMTGTKTASIITDKGGVEAAGSRCQ